jgi:hypothetical protein
LRLRIQALEDGLGESRTECSAPYESRKKKKKFKILPCGGMLLKLNGYVKKMMGVADAL